MSWTSRARALSISSGANGRARRWKRLGYRDRHPNFVHGGWVGLGQGLAQAGFVGLPAVPVWWYWSQILAVWFQGRADWDMHMCMSTEGDAGVCCRTGHVPLPLLSESKDNEMQAFCVNPSLQGAGTTLSKAVAGRPVLWSLI